MAGSDPSNQRSFTIPAGQSESNALDISVIGARGLAALINASNWTAADLAFQVSSDGVNWHNIRDSSGNGVKITGISTSAARLYVAPAECWVVRGFKYLRVSSRSTSDFETKVNQVNAIPVVVYTLS